MSVDDPLAIGVETMTTEIDNIASDDRSCALATGVDSMATYGNSPASNSNPPATGFHSVAHSVATTGDSSPAIGVESMATRNNSPAIIVDTMATGNNSPTIGVDDSMATGNNSPTIGVDDSMVTGNISSVIGVKSVATGGRSKRRSMFTKRRVSLLERIVPSPQLGQDVSSHPADLHTVIDENLPNEHRLAKLVRLGLKHTFNTLGNEFKGREWFDKIRVAAEESGNLLVSQLQDGDTFVNACSVAQKESDPCFEDIDRIAIEHAINRLDDESQKWDGLLEEFKLEAAEAEKKAENLEINPEELSEKIKSIAEACYMKPIQDYQELVRAARNISNTSALQMEKYCNIVHLLGRAAKKADVMEKSLLQQLHEETFKGMPSQTSMDPVRDLLSTEYIIQE